MSRFFSIFRIVAAIICGLLALSFAATILNGLINQGSVIGLVLSTSVVIMTIIYPKLKHFRAFRIFSYIFAALACTAAIYTAVVSAYIVSCFVKEPELYIEASADGGPTHTVIVLGCQTINGKPSDMLKARLDKAIEYLNAHDDAVCIVTGGMGGDEIEPESVTMYRYLITNGINKDIIYTEENSANTEENIINSKKLIEENGLPRDLVIISECYHVYRGVRNAEKAGLNACAVSADVTGYWFTLPSYWLREIFAISRDYVYDLV